ncbi:DUF5627 domain-containing protein [Bacteroides sp. UBA939]|uniref:DUF5627 domain-containing protein n=1 Tax=Bacteroides sp. UBA939 TaxID=1946092 RepID=UPI0025B93F08|nr:DUF5627 domain-containing protein [Bacteroides sp. UBA939]
MNKNKLIMKWMVLGALLAGCENADKEFDDFEYQTISFATQTPVRTITLGEDVYPTELDNEYRMQIIATLGGIWDNRKERVAQIAIDNDLCRGAYFANGNPVLPMPENYYTYTSGNVVFPKGEIYGRMDIQLTDAFFNDALAPELTYVIPVRLVQGSDSILQGKPKDNVSNPNRLNAGDWDVLPKDYALYAVTYKNKYEGLWLSRGTDRFNINGRTSTVERNPAIEKADERALGTIALNKVRYPITVSVDVVNEQGEAAKQNLNMDLLITLDDNGNCTITTDTPDATASGSGKWTYHGAKKAWGDKDRDLFELTYEVTYPPYVLNVVTGEMGTASCSSEDTLVARDRQSKFETFNVVLK